MSEKLTKSEAREKADELGIEYTSQTPVSELRKLIEAEELPEPSAPEVPEVPEETEKEAPVEEAKEEAPAKPAELVEEAPVEKPIVIGGKKIEGSKILSIEKVGNLYQIKAENGNGYTLPESEYKAL